MAIRVTKKRQQPSNNTSMQRPIITNFRLEVILLMNTFDDDLKKEVIPDLICFKRSIGLIILL